MSASDPVPGEISEAVHGPAPILRSATRNKVFFLRASTVFKLYF